MTWKSIENSRYNTLLSLAHLHFWQSVIYCLGWRLQPVSINYKEKLSYMNLFNLSSNRFKPLASTVCFDEDFHNLIIHCIKKCFLWSVLKPLLDTFINLFLLLLLQGTMSNPSLFLILHGFMDLYYYPPFSNLLASSPTETHLYFSSFLLFSLLSF